MSVPILVGEGRLMLDPFAVDPITFERDDVYAGFCWTKIPTRLNAGALRAINVVFRPAVLLGGQTGDFVAVAGSGSDGNRPRVATMSIRYPPGISKVPIGEYDFRRLITVDAESDELLSFFSAASHCTVVRAADGATLPLLRQHLGAVLGLLPNESTPKFIAADFARRARLRRGEVVLVRYRAGVKETPFVVVSANDVNGEYRDSCIALPLVPGDDNDDGYVALCDVSTVVSAVGRRTVDARTLVGLTGLAEDRLRRPVPQVDLAIVAPGAWSRVNAVLAELVTCKP